MTQLNAVEADFFDRAPIRIQRRAVVRASAEAVFTTIACDPHGYARWFPGFSTASNWTSAPPYGAGSQRTMLALGSSFEETVLTWKPNAEFAFRADVFPFPGHRGFAERWRVRALDELSTELARLTAIEPAGFAPVVRVVWSLVTRVMMGLAARGLSRHLSTN